MGKHESFEEKWPILEVIVNKVIDCVHLDINMLTPAEYMIGYTIVYEAHKCVKCAKKYYEEYRKTLADYINSMVLPQLKQKNGETFLKELLQHWNKYRNLQKWLFKMFQRLDESFTRLNCRPSLMEISCLIFHIKIYYGNQVRDILISEIKRDRNGEEIDHALMKNVLKIYLEMTCERHSMRYYEMEFETVMLAHTAQFYSRKALEWLLMTCSDASPYDSYMQKVQGSLEEEKTRVANYLDNRSLNKLMKVVKHELIEVYERKLEEMIKQK